MAEKFVIDISNLSWAIVSASGTIIQASSCDSPAQLAQISEDKEVIVIVPAEDVLLAHCKLPKMNKTKMHAAVPYALEDQLIDDIDALHFVAYPSRDTQETIVLVVAHEKMQKWLRELQEINIKADKLIPAFLAVPVPDDTDSINIIVDHRIMVRVDEFSAFTCDKEAFNFYLDALMQKRAANIDNYTQVSLNLDVIKQERFLNQEQYIQNLALNAVNLDQHINLLQGRHTLKSAKFNSMQKLKKTMSSLAVIWVLLVLLYPLASYFMLKSRNNLLNQRIVEIYKLEFPQSQGVVAPKLRMQKKLAQLKDKRSEDHFLILMGHIGKALQNATQIKLNRFDYQNKQVLLTVTAPSSKEISSLSNAIISQGLNVKQQNALSSGNEMNATLQIE